MSGSFFAHPKKPGRSYRPVTLNEALLAVFAVGLLLGLWLGGLNGRKEFRELKDLQRRVENLEYQRTLFQNPFFSRPGHTPNGSSPETDTQLEPESVPVVRV